jgi:hypothetical protein
LSGRQRRRIAGDEIDFGGPRLSSSTTNARPIPPLACGIGIQDAFQKVDALLSHGSGEGSKRFSGGCDGPIDVG